MARHEILDLEGGRIVLGLDRYVGQAIAGLNGAEVRVTQAGVVAAAHREGVDALSDYLRRRITRKKAPDEQSGKQDLNVQKRLRDFANVTYEPHR